MGFAHEFEEEVWDSINLLKGLNPKTINVYLATIYRGTSLYKQYIAQGLLDSNSTTDQLLGGNKGLKRFYMSDEKVKGLQRCFPLYVRLPDSFYDSIKQAEQDDKLFAELREVFIKEFYN
jgi:hypothetical protein